MRKRWIAGGGALALCAGAVPFALAQPDGAKTAPVAAASGWKTDLVLPWQLPATISAFVATGRADAWAFAVKDSDDPRPSALRWNGRTWAEQAFPAGLRCTPGAAGALSPRDVWLVCVNRKGSTLLRWNGSKWSVSKKWAKRTVSTLRMFGPRDVWATGVNDPETEQRGLGTVHYDGRKWRQVSTPLPLAEVDGVSGRDLWALADRDRATTVLRYDGRRWRKFSTGNALPKPVRARGDKPWREVRPGSLTVVGEKNVWVTAEVWDSRPVPGEEHDDTRIHTVAAHWDGERWRRVALPRADRLSVLDGISDGRGGVWFAAARNLREVATDPDPFLIHRAANGRTTVEPLRTKQGTGFVYGFAPIPGGTGLFGVGEILGKDSEHPAVFRR